MSRKQFITIATFSVLLLAVGCNQRQNANLPVNNNTPQTGQTQSYSNKELGISFRYPSDVFTLTAELSKVTLMSGYHISNDMKGTGESNDHYFSIEFQSFPQNIVELARSSKFNLKDLFPKGTVESFVQNGGYMDKYMVGGKTGYRVIMGVEGVYTDYIFVPQADKQTLVITYNYFNNSVFVDYPESANISINEQDKIFQQVMDSVVLSTPTAELQIVKVYFANEKIKATTNCNEVVPVERTIIKTAKVGVAAINELLKSPSAAEKAQGYLTLIPVGSKLNSLAIVNGEARADFNELTESGGGSCSMALRSAQIRETLKQFYSVKTVKLSINGRTEDIFQP